MFIQAEETSAASLYLGDAWNKKLFFFPKSN